MSRWLAGRVRPTQHNLTRIADVPCQPTAGFLGAFLRGREREFRALLVPAAEPSGQGHCHPFGAVEAARRETARRGVEYFGAYMMYYWSFSAPEDRPMALLLRPEDGLIEARYGPRAFPSALALLMLNRMYVIFAEERFEAMAFLVLNAASNRRRVRHGALGRSGRGVFWFQRLARRACAAPRSFGRPCPGRGGASGGQSAGTDP